jgi:hypothetical protein
MFSEYDVNKSGDIDIFEVKKILLNMEMDHSLEQAQELMNAVDKDGSGVIDFSEFCRFVALLKQGDEKFSKFSKLIDNLNNTPLGFLEMQSKLRNLKPAFRLVEEREANATTTAICVVEVITL